MDKSRTLKQNASLHLYCRKLAKALNEAGISQAIFVKGLEVDNSEQSVKEVFRSLAKAKYLEGSTAKLNTKEMTDIYEEINRHTAKIGIYVAWPSEEEINLEKNYS